ncbi:MAG: M1 family aminopeptidase, partial [Bacteroidales bacterium]
CNTGKRPIEMIGFDYCLNSYQLLRVRQDGVELDVFNPATDIKLNNPVYYILNRQINATDSLFLEVEFMRQLYFDPNPEEYLHKNLIPRLWWENIPVSDSYRVKMNKPPGYSVAVSGRYDTGTGYYSNNNASNFGFFFSRRCSPIEDEIMGVKVRILYPEDGKKVADLVLETARDVIPFYSDFFGSYPYEFLNILPGGDGVYGGYPFASGMVVIHRMQYFEYGTPRHWRWITAHEIGHQYWGEYVLDSDNPPWLWIALGIYADREFSKHSGLSDSWYRNWTELYLDGIRKGYNTILHLRPEEEVGLEFDRNNYVVHAKGFSFISALELALGKEVFQSVFKAAFDEYGGYSMSLDEFQLICEIISGENLNWFFDPWTRTNKYLSAVIGDTKSEKTDNVYKSIVNIYHDGGIIMPIPVFGLFSDGTSQVKYTNRLSRHSMVEFESISPLVGAAISPDGYLANFINPPDPQLKEFKNEVNMLPWSGNGELPYRLYRKAFWFDGAEIGRLWYKLGMTLFDSGYYSEAERAFCYANKYGSEEENFINYCWIGHIQDITNRRTEAVESYKLALDACDGDAYFHPQYNLTINESWINNRLKTPFMGVKMNW